MPRIRALQPDIRFAASTTLAELFFGALVLGTRGQQYLQRIEQRVLPGLTILPFDAPAARRFAEIKAELQRRGQPIGDPDVQIAAVALANNLVVATDSTRHFERVPNLAVENWLA